MVGIPPIQMVKLVMFSYCFIDSVLEHWIWGTFIFKTHSDSHIQTLVNHWLVFPDDSNMVYPSSLGWGNDGDVSILFSELVYYKC